MGGAQTGALAPRGLGPRDGPAKAGEWLWESQPERVKAPYPKPKPARRDPEYTETRGTLVEEAGTTPQG